MDQLDWPPDVFVADNEIGLASEEFAAMLGRAGTLFAPTAGYAPWQKGKVERRTQSSPSIVRKTVMHRSGQSHEMKMIGMEAVAAMNQRPGPTGVSPSMMLFGQRLEVYGELYANGEATAHPDAADHVTQLHPPAIADTRYLQTDV